jgi:hypothetical protein
MPLIYFERESLHDDSLTLVNFYDTPMVVAWRFFMPNLLASNITKDLVMLDFWQRYTNLALVLAATVFITNFTNVVFVCFKE